MKRNLKILLCFAVMFCCLISPWSSLTVYANKNTADAAESEYVIFTEKNIKTEDMRKKSKLDEKKLTEYMEKFPNLSGIEKTLMEIQDEYNVNALLILAIVRLESGNGKSQIAKSRNNLGGIIGWEKSVRVYKSFDSRSDCVVYMAKLLSENYLTEGGKYHSGYTLADIAKKYSTASDKWTELVKTLIYEVQEGINNTAIK